MTERLDSVQPVLMVRDVESALRFYRLLGFRETFRDTAEAPRYCGIRRDSVELHLQWHDAREWTYPNDRPTYRFPVADPDALHAELRASGALADATEVRDMPWGTREFHLRDPDLNGLQFYRSR